MFSVKNWSRDWAAESYAFPHESLRRDLFLTERVLQKSFDATIPWHITSFYGWFGALLPIVHGHHMAEEEVFFPAIQRKSGRPLPDQMTADHTTLISSLEEVASLKEKFLAAAGKEKELKQLESRLRDTFHTLYVMMTEHLNEEEDVLVPLIRAHMTEKDMEDTVQEILKKFSVPDLLWELSPFVSWYPLWCSCPNSGCDVQRMEQFKDQIPLPVRLLNKFFMMPRWENALATLKGIEDGVEIPYNPRQLRPLEIGLLAVVVVLVLTVLRTIRRCFGKGPSKKPTNNAGPSKSKKE